MYLNFAGDNLGGAFHSPLIRFRKPSDQWTVNIQNANRLTLLVAQRNDQFTVARAIAGNMPGKGVNILNTLRTVLRNCRAANALTKSNSGASGLSLKRTEY